MQARILWIEGKRANSPAFVLGLRKKGFIVEVVTSGQMALTRYAEFDPDLIVLDVASMHTSGQRIARLLRDQTEDVPLVVIDPARKSRENLEANLSPSDLPVPPVPAPGASPEIQEANVSSDAPPVLPKPPRRVSHKSLEADVTLALPFTVRKLINRIRPLLPGDGGKLLHVGPIRLDLERKRVRCQGRDATLTPRLAQLLKLFLEHPGEAMMRGQLFRDIWETEYTVDTRTLDVHMSWLRQAIEEDPRKPRFLKTIRGVGYRLDI